MIQPPEQYSQRQAKGATAPFTSSDRVFEERPMSIASGAINVPGSIKLARSPAPLVKVNELLHIRFERPERQTKLTERATRGTGAGVQQTHAR
jgi:hypothetical protein